ncbi:MAG: phosphoribosylanthranilate isomerase [Saprospiraceae bacterium]
MKHPQNIADIAALNPDYLGFIFYEKSKRYVGENFDETTIYHLPKGIKKIGVFVNSSLEYVLSKVEKYGLDLVQLHGEESPEFCRANGIAFAKNGLNTKIIKVFSIGQTFDFQQLEPYKPYCDYFLFDTKGKEKGGNGFAFNWDVLKDYDNEKPFFLSGGLSLENIEEVQKLEGLNIIAIDVNSGFEIEPGLKDVEKVRKCIDVLMS